MTARHARLGIRSIGKDIEANNGRVGVRLAFCDGGYAQEFYASADGRKFQLVLSSIHKNLIPSSQHRALSSPMISGERAHLFGVCRESLRMVYDHAEIASQDDEIVVMRLTGSVQGHSLRCDITVREGCDAIHVAVEDQFKGGSSEPVLEYLMSSYAFLPRRTTVTTADELDYV